MGLIKKIAVVGVLGGLGAATVANTKIGSYMSYRAERAWEQAEAQIPLDHEISRIKKEVLSLDKDIDKAKGNLAEQIVAERMQKEACDNLTRNIERQEALVHKQAEALKEAKTGEKVKWDGRTVSYNRAKEMFESDVQRLKNNRKEMEAQKQMMATHEKSRLILEQQLHAMIAQKSELKAAVADMESQIRMVKLQQIESRYQNDGTRLADIKESLRELQTRVEVQREKLKLAETYSTDTAVSGKSVDEILADLDGKSASTDNTGTRD